MERKVWSFITENDLIRERQKVAAAVSGGADSLALLLCLHELSETQGFELIAAHLEHGIRGDESLADAEFVRSRCRELGVPFFLERVDVPAMALRAGAGLELAGRLAREEFFGRLKRDGLADVVATAHHREDNAESVLMHVLRGCGTDGLSGIRPRRGMLIRPFLCLSKEEILAYLRGRGETWREDSTNEDTTYTRNYIRGVAMPALRDHVNPRLTDSLNRLSAAAARDAACLDRFAKQAASTMLESSPFEARLSVGALREQDPAIASRIVLEAMRRLGRRSDVERAHVRMVEGLLCANKTGSQADLGGGLQARVEYGELIFSKAKATAPAWETKTRRGRNALANGGVLYIDDVCERGQSDAFREYVDGDKLPENLTARNRRPGDVFQPLNAPGSRKLKEYFIDRKVPREERDRATLLTRGNRVLWVAGHRISQDLRIDAETKRICRLTYEPAPEER